MAMGEQQRSRWNRYASIERKPLRGHGAASMNGYEMVTRTGFEPVLPP